MNTRHRKQLSTPLMSKVLTLNRYLLDKSSQSRKLVQYEYIAPILQEARLLFLNVGDLLDGQDAAKKAMRNLYKIQQQTILVGFLERDNRAKKGGPGKKKHYGFDFAATAYIDEMCDDLLTHLSAYGQSHQPFDRG